MSKEYEELEERVRQLELQLAKYKGAIGAVLLIGSSLGFIANFIFEFFFKK